MTRIRIEFPQLPHFDRRIDPTPENRMPGWDDVALEMGVPVEIPHNKGKTFQDINYSVGHLDYPFYPESKE